MPNRDERKRSTNIRNYGLDFVGCEAIFDGPVLVLEDSRQNYGEQRLCALGLLDSILVHMTYTERAADFHVTSLREAEKYEIKRYVQEISN